MTHEMKTLKDLKKDAGEKLAEKVLDIFKYRSCRTTAEQEAINWFYNHTRILDGESPNDLCKKSKSQTIDNLLESYKSEPWT